MSKDNDLLYQMKLREIESFKWQEDIIEPLSKEFNISVDEMNEIFIENLDMSQIDSLHATYQSALHDALHRKLYVDLHLQWFIDVLGIVTVEQGDKIRLPLAKKLINGADYNEILQEGRNKLLFVLKENYE